MDARQSPTYVYPKICPACGLNHNTADPADLPEKCRVQEEDSITLDEWLRTYDGPYPIKD